MDDFRGRIEAQLLGMLQDVQELVGQARELRDQRRDQNDREIQQNEALSETPLEELDGMLWEYLCKAARLTAMPQAQTPIACAKRLLPHQRFALGRLQQW